MLGRVRKALAPTALASRRFCASRSSAILKALLPVIEVLEDDHALLLSTFRRGRREGARSWCIGHENPASELAGVSIVACPYGRGESEGVVAVIRPTRMNYERAIRAVRAAQCALHGESRALPRAQKSERRKARFTYHGRN